MQDEDMVTCICVEELPPDEYCEMLDAAMRKKRPGADPDLIAGVVALIIAMDIATAFAPSFGIPKFALAQMEARLVGEAVGRYGGRPTPEIVRAIRKGPPVETLQGLQEFPGTRNYNHCHAGPAYARMADPLRALLGPGGDFLPNEK